MVVEVYVWQDVKMLVSANVHLNVVHRQMVVALVVLLIVVHPVKMSVEKTVQILAPQAVKVIPA